MNDQIKEISNVGVSYFRNKISSEWIESLRREAEISFQKHYDIQVKNRMERPNRWLALNAIGDSQIYLNFVQDLIQHQEIESFLTEYFSGAFILNSFSALSAKRGDDNFSLNIHRDSRNYLYGTNMMLNFLIMLDDFSEEKGATYILPNSHRKREKPTDDFFYANSERAVGKSGDILVFHSDIWHAAGKNLTELPRRGIAMTFTKPFLKQLVDIPRMIGEASIKNMDPKMRRILGFTSRVPANLHEWYQPIENRYYLSGQE